jgi:hypothetical protein
MSRKTRRKRGRATTCAPVSTPIVFAQLTTGDLHLSSVAKANVPRMVLVSPALSAAVNGATVQVPGHAGLYMTATAMGGCCKIVLMSAGHGPVLTIGIAADLATGAALWREMNDGAFGLLDGDNPPPALWCGARYEDGPLSAPPEQLRGLPPLVMCLGWTWMMLSGVTR